LQKTKKQDFEISSRKKLKNGGDDHKDQHRKRKNQKGPETR